MIVWNVAVQFLETKKVLTQPYFSVIIKKKGVKRDEGTLLVGVSRMVGLDSGYR